MLWRIPHFSPVVCRHLCSCSGFFHRFLFPYYKFSFFYFLHTILNLTRSSDLASSVLLSSYVVVCSGLIRIRERASSVLVSVVVPVQGLLLLMAPALLVLQVQVLLLVRVQELLLVHLMQRPTSPRHARCLRSLLHENALPRYI